MSAGYSDDVFQGELRRLEARRKRAADAADSSKNRPLRQPRGSVPPQNGEGQTETALHDIAALLQNPAKSGLTFEPAPGSALEQVAKAPWNNASAEALLRSVGDANIEPVRTITQLCEDLIIKLGEALRIPTAELDKVNVALDQEDQRIAQIPAAKNAGDSSCAYAGFGGVEAMRNVLDRFDRVEGDLSEAVKRLEACGADIRAYLLIDSAMEAAQHVSWNAPLESRDLAAKTELEKLRLAIEHVEAALKEVDATLMGAGNAARSLEK